MGGRGGGGGDGGVKVGEGGWEDGKCIIYIFR